MIDIEKFICSLMRFTPVSKEVKYLINCALKDQGLEYKDGKIVNVEPRFKVGDWVVYCHEDVDLITGIEEDGYTINEGGYIPFVCASDIRLWTIQDAKDGDVLYTSSTASNEVFIFKELTIEGYIECYCSYDSEDKYCKGKYHFIGKPTFMTHPATKEQRDLLFAKMHEAGYEWDAENKQLKKIEPKKEPTEFECGYKQAIEDAVRYMDKVWGLNILGNSINDFRETMEQKLKELSQG